MHELLQWSKRLCFCIFDWSKKKDESTNWCFGSRARAFALLTALRNQFLLTQISKHIIKFWWLELCPFFILKLVHLRSKPESTSWCFGARAGALCNYGQTKTKCKKTFRTLSAWVDLGVGIVCPFFVFMIVHSFGQSLSERAGSLEH